MNPWVTRAVILPAVVLGLAGSAAAQQVSPDPKPGGAASGTRPVAVEAGVVMGIIASPYLTARVLAGPWSFRVSGADWDADHRGVQFNLGRVVRDTGNARHTLSLTWARYTAPFYYRSRPNQREYWGVMYDFNVKGFFIEAGPGFGSKNPWGLGPSHVYGQVGYMYRFGKKYEDDDNQ